MVEPHTLAARRMDAFDLVLDEKLRCYAAPFALANREDDYRVAWAFFQSASRSV